MTPRGFLGLVILLLAMYCGLDPLKHSAISEFPDFVSHKVDMPPWSLIPTVKDDKNLLQNSEIKFLNQIQGPESMAFDPLGRGPYTGVADGRILFWDGLKWTDFAFTSNNRSELCNPKPIAMSYLKNEHICGRPLGLRFDKKTGDLYIADAYFGLMKVGPEGGLATSLATEAEGVPLRFTNDLDIDDEGNVYFTDSSTNYQRRHKEPVLERDSLVIIDACLLLLVILIRFERLAKLVFSAEDTGRVLKYDPTTKQTTVLLRNLQFPNGLSLSKDKSFFVFCEGSVGRLHKYWLIGEKAGNLEAFAILPGYPDNVRTNEKGEFWVAIHCRRSLYSHLMALYPKIRHFVLKLPISAKTHYLIHIGGRLHAMAVKYSPEGKILQVLEDSKGKVVKAISEVEEKDGKLWMGSVLMPFVAVYDLS
ncbi:protein STRICTOSIDINE SYNTHASE-LIKE 3 [Citrus sinensis]|nr:protein STRICTOSIDINE SYNTHASE-LIKE 3 [Citrus sinensis]